jgi:GLPGLI family protein
MYNSMDAQPLDIMYMKCQYKHKNTVQGMYNTKEEIDTMSLDIGKNVCKFYSHYNQIVDSLRHGYEPGQSPYKKTSNLYKIYTNYAENNITVVDAPRATATFYEYVEKLEIPEWTIHDETKDILSHTCKKATCRFRGRDYTAWYAVDIPISRGPYKFNGLPGLILEIFDTELLFIFECIGIEKKSGIIIKDKEEIPAKKISKKEFITIEKRFYDNPRATFDELLKSLGARGNTFQLSEGKIPYNPIELEE